jgi:ABC-2 type transport system ATP-binding protein
VQADEAVHRTLTDVALLDAAGKKIKECSKGMRQRLALAQALIGNPSLLLLDEPSSGLDPEGQAHVCRLIKQLHERGKTIILASHQLAEVTQVCTQLVILNLGQILYQSSMEEALAERPHTTIQVNMELEPLVPLLTNLHPEIEIDTAKFEVILNHEAIKVRPQVLGILLESGYDITHIEQSHVTLAEIYAEAVA